MEYKFKRVRLDKISRDSIIVELKKVAEHNSYIEFSFRDFDNISEISSSTVKNEFGSWSKALAALRVYLQDNNLKLFPRKEPYNRSYSNQQLFKEMDRIWKELGHRPSQTEWELCKPSISYGTYKRRFNGWANACLKFIENKMGSNITTDEYSSNCQSKEIKISKLNNHVEYKPENTRNISFGLRYKILNRDNFRCVLCGRSPAIDIGVKLHIDHIIPFSKGGKSIIENLQTLCIECNIEKSNKENILPKK